MIAMMKSPFTGKEMMRIYEKRTWNFRGEQFEYYHTAWQCPDTGEQFTTDESDTAGFMQVTNQYRQKYGIPYTDEIIAVRNKYGISAAKMSLILGIGVNQYRLYEKGEVPSVSNGRMIRSIMNPKVMLDMIESSKHELSPQEYAKISEKVKVTISENENFKIAQYETNRIFTSPRGEENGFAPTSLTRLKNIMLSILNQCNGMWCTKMNKLLFYIDFYAYRERGYAMTGLTYKAIDFGPVPERWDRVYSEFSEISQDIQQCGDYEGSILHAHSPITDGVLSDDEIQIITTVCKTFGNKSSREVSQISHNENAWLNHHDAHERISFNEAFSLKAL